MRISVIIPVHDARMSLEQTLETVFGQTLAPTEVIVVDDGSSADIAARLRDLDFIRPKVQMIRTAHRGAAAARNAGARLATGDALFFCDADLVLDPRLLERLAAALAARLDASFAYCSFEWGGKTFVARPFDRVTLERNNFISTMSLISREAFPGFDESLARFQDWDLWLTVAERGGVGVAVPETLFRVAEEGTMSRRGGLSRLLATAKIRRKHRLAWQASDLWLALKESLKARRI